MWIHHSLGTKSPWFLWVTLIHKFTFKQTYVTSICSTFIKIILNLLSTKVRPQEPGTFCWLPMDIDHQEANDFTAFKDGYFLY